MPSQRNECGGHHFTRFSSSVKNEDPNDTYTWRNISYRPFFFFFFINYGFVTCIMVSCPSVGDASGHCSRHWRPRSLPCRPLSSSWENRPLNLCLLPTLLSFPSPHPPSRPRLFMAWQFVLAAVGGRGLDSFAIAFTFNHLHFAFNPKREFSSSQPVPQTEIFTMNINIVQGHLIQCWAVCRISNWLPRGWDWL